MACPVSMRFSVDFIHRQRGQVGGNVLATEKLIELGSDLDLAMTGGYWNIYSAVPKELRSRHPKGYPPAQEEAMNLVRTHAVEKEKQTLRQTLAEVEQEQSPEVAEQPAPRRRARL